MLQPLTIPVTSELITVGDTQIEVQRCGTGSPVLLLPGEEGLEFESPFLTTLASNHEVTVFWPPGFARSNRPDWITCADDVSYIYLDLLGRLGLDKIPIVGCSLGGWLAAEMATKNDTRISKLVLVAPLGIKVGGPTDRDIADIYALHPSKVSALKWADPDRGQRDLKGRSDEELFVIARNIESFARLCWEPYMHNPKLKKRLHRISVPTLFVWGERDGIVKPDYGRAYAELVPGAKLRVIADAGHLPHVEQPKAFFDEVTGFLA